jgi:hypothetical protein
MMNALIEFVCRAHPTAKGPGPLITLVDGEWAYCEGNGRGGHEWIRMEPTRREQIEDRPRMVEMQAS